MYLEELVEVAMGLIFAWLILSVATMQIQEYISTKILNKRAKDLKSTIGNMLNDQDKLDEFYEHPLITSLIEPMKGLKKLIWDNVKDDKQDKWYYGIISQWVSKIPSYIPPDNFSAAMFDVVANAGTEKSPIKGTVENLRENITDKKILDHILKLGKVVANSEEVNDFQKGVKKTLIDQIDALNNSYSNNPTVQGLTKELKSAINDPNANLQKLFESDQVLEQVRNGAEALGVDAAIGKSLNSLLAGAEEIATDTEKALALGRTNVENWFDNVMERMNGWYKRWAHSAAFIIGLVLAILFNVDSIDLATTLWREPTLRQAYASYVDGFVKDATESAENLGEIDLQPVQDKIDELSIPIGWETVTYEGPDVCSIPANEKERVGFYMPFSDEDPETAGIQAPCIEITNAPGDISAIWLKLIGILLSAMAAMQGAPFWFDILKKIVNVRNTGSNPAEKPKEKAA